MAGLIGLRPLRLSDGTTQPKEIGCRILSAAVILEKQEERSYHTDEEESTTPRKKKSEDPKGQYDWVIQCRKKRKAANSPKTIITPPSSSLPSKQVLQITANKLNKVKVAPPSIYISGLKDINEVTNRLQKLEFK
ncbi:Rna-directed dna polymerase from mobile element jockey-like protein [Temnothorax longispinosus]|uniref:Rna-directed dna polymerase from mobile element jockey-like protein n=1 Tax=Temnothorax longispinosus TaxID=300112 RepID=A0A4S2L3Q6_9HYME|nr:Rna-directed dna polymerase from mobile element jockey-like protein [Temnothorax longispinosus]